MDRNSLGLSEFRWRKLLTLPLDLYAAFIVAYLLLRVVTTGHFWPVEVLSVIIHWLLLLAILLLPAALWMRRWPTATLLAVSGAAFVWLFGSLFIPRNVRLGFNAPHEQSSTLTVMSYNIGNGLASPDSLIKVINESGADIVAMQDMTLNQIAGLKAGLQNVYPFQVIHGAGISGIGLLSRYPILEEQLFSLGGSNPYLQVKLQVGNEIFTVIVAHPPVAFGPGGPDAPSRADLPVLADMVVKNDPAIMLGDLNFTDQNDGYSYLQRTRLVDAFRAAGFGLGLTYPKRRYSGAPFLPLLRIDYIFVTDDMFPVRAWVGEDGGSDHLPVLAELIW
ncbi:MAG: endonuclease/exonuclease/phosphatase family protein [Anaerolineales bacterium]|nr:endonuclease/exonuclease/phosphatase family protein [Anaerolineales bacterium]